MEETAKIGKEASGTKFKGNSKQFELNSLLNSILTQIEGSVENPSKVLKFVAEGEQVIKERQKLIKVADKIGRVTLWFKSTSPTISRLIQRMRKSFARQKALWRGKEKKSRASVVMRSKKFKSGSDSQLFVVGSLTVLL